jgi:hypothetical protein
MNKFLTLLISFVIILGTGGCNHAAQPTSVQSETSSSSTSSSDVDVTLNNIHIGRATDELLSKYNSFHEYINDEGGDRLIIWTDTEVKDFAFISINCTDMGDKVSYDAGDALFSPGNLSPEKPFVVKLLIPGSLPAYGISFVDQNGLKRYFTINLDGRGEEEAPPYFLHEFENGNGE